MTFHPMFPAHTFQLPPAMATLEAIWVPRGEALL
jgi:hypothetical protein